MSALEMNDKEQKLEELLNDDISLETDEDNVNEDIDEANEEYQVYSGEALNSQEIYQIAAKENMKMLFIVGPTASGKTTMETTLYQLFQRGAVGSFYFAGSNTLQGFEQRAFYTRVMSKGSVPDTPRTSLESNQSFLHLRLWQYKRDIINNFVFADLSGENFESHIGQVEKSKETFSFLRRADYIIGVLDCEKLIDKKNFQSTVSQMIRLLRTFYDAELIDEACVLQLVFSKYDLVVKNTNSEQLINKAKQIINSSLNEMYPNIEFYNVAAMPKVVGEYNVGYGLKELLESWIENRTYLNSNKKEEPFDSFSEFDKLSIKFKGDINE